MIINRQNAMQNNGFWMGQIQGSYLYNESREEWINNYETLVKNVNNKQLKAFANQFIKLDNYTLVVLKPENK